MRTKYLFIDIDYSTPGEPGCEAAAGVVLHLSGVGRNVNYHGPSWSVDGKYGRATVGAYGIAQVRYSTTGWTIRGGIW